MDTREAIKEALAIQKSVKAKVAELLDERSLMATEEEAVAQQREYEAAEEAFQQQPRPYGAGGYR